MEVKRITSADEAFAAIANGNSIIVASEFAATEFSEDQKRILNQTADVIREGGSFWIGLRRGDDK